MFHLQTNVDAATPAEAIGLLSEDGAPWCYAPNATVLKCSTLAERTARSGVYELEVQMLRCTLAP